MRARGAVALALALAAAAAAAAAGGGAGLRTKHDLQRRRLLQTDFLGKDPRGADTRGADVKGADPIGQDTLGGGRGRPSAGQPSAAPAPGPAPAPAPAPVAPTPTVARPGAAAGPAPAPEPESATGCITAAQLLAADPNTTITSRLAQAAGLGAALSDPGQQFTLFAPDDIAWMAFFEGVKASEGQLAADSQLLGALLRYHVVPGQAVPEAQWSAATTFPSLATAQFLGVRPPGGTDPSWYLEGATGYLLGVVLQADRPACAALVHVIGGVMISNEADLLLMQRGLVASSSPAPAQG